MKRVELYARVRHAVMIDGLSQRQAARRRASESLDDAPHRRRLPSYPTGRLGDLYGSLSSRLGIIGNNLGGAALCGLGRLAYQRAISVREASSHLARRETVFVDLADRGNLGGGFHPRAAMTVQARPD